MDRRELLSVLGAGTVGPGPAHTFSLMEKTLRNQAETEKGSDLRRQCEATVGKSGKPCASRAVPKSPQNPRICPCSQRGISRSPLMITLKCALALLRLLPVRGR